MSEMAYGEDLGTGGELDSELMSQWIHLPGQEAGGAAEARSWAELQAANVATRCGLDDEAAGALTDTLLRVNAEAEPVGEAIRLLHLADPALGATLWHLTVVRPLSGEALTGMLAGEEDPTLLSSQLDEFELSGHRGAQVVSFGLPPAGSGALDGPDAEAIYASVRLAVCRAIGGDPTTVVMWTYTANLEAALAAIPAARLLLTDERLAESLAPRTSGRIDRPEPSPVDGDEGKRP